MTKFLAIISSIMLTGMLTIVSTASATGTGDWTGLVCKYLEHRIGKLEGKQDAFNCVESCQVFVYPTTQAGGSVFIGVAEPDVQDPGAQCSDWIENANDNVTDQITQVIIDAQNEGFAVSGCNVDRLYSTGKGFCP